MGSIVQMSMGVLASRQFLIQAISQLIVMRFYVEERLFLQDVNLFKILMVIVVVRVR
jgi:hypothetical protein